ncbi:MAG: glycerol-3-phosphate 1-O-acyltransferase PlsY [Clostridia bacterium]|nr:glycerol-3-phosphate 1-O-acyltransferase PlsY [Clostridia bacterium]
MLDMLLDRWPVVPVIAVMAYLLGSINWAIIITRLRSRKDIREVGSGNAGATNVLRSQGVLPAVLTLIGDGGKGVLAALAGGWIASLLPVGEMAFGPEELTVFGRYVAAVFVVTGHVFPVFYGFRGGKGVAAIGGLLFVLDWRVGLIAVGVFALTVLLSRMVSLGSVLAGVAIIVSTFVLCCWVDRMVMETVWFCTISIGIPVSMAIAKHGGNIRRIIAGTERRIGEKVSVDTESSAEQGEQK